MVKLGLYYSQKQKAAGVLLRLVQPNINQKDKWKPLLINKHINTLLSMSTRESANFSTSPTHIIWPGNSKLSLFVQE